MLPARDQQKELLDSLNVATARWQKLDDPQDLTTAKNTIANQLVIKSIRDGYDGKGQWVITDDHSELPPADMYSKIIAEEKINFQREVSIVGSRFSNGDTCFFPLVENYHQAGMLRYTLAPASRHHERQGMAEEMLKAVMNKLEYVGVMAMELFDCEQGLLVNEIAPRVHNSGHWTQAGTTYSQFDLHLLSILDKYKPDLAVSYPITIMLNLIGCQWNSDWQKMSGIQTYWYGKSWRENRKLGHINIMANSVSELIDKCKQLNNSLDAFHQQMLDKAITDLSSRYL